MHRWVLVPTLAVLGVFALTPTARAVTIDVTTDGTFSGTSPYANYATYCGGQGQPVCTAPANPDVQVRWGQPAYSGQPKSGLGFQTGVTAATEAGPFVIGSLTHFNFPIYYSAQHTVLSIDIVVTEGTTVLFDQQVPVVFAIDETPNSQPCPYPSATPCSDRIQLNFAAAGSTFTSEVNGMTYSLTLVGFRDSETDPTVPVDHFLSDEGQSNTAWLFATFEAVGCGDGVLDPGEECDDGNLEDGDGCDRFCKLNESPVAVCQDQLLEANAQCQACGSVDGGSYDPDSLVWTVVESPVCPWGLGQTTVGLTITDTEGASDACSAQVTVTDATAPVVGSCPASEELSLDATCHASGTYTATASDNCAGGLSASHTYSFGGAGSDSHTYSFSDDFGNTASCAQTVSAADHTPPTISCPADAVLDLDGGCAAQQSYTASGADNCAGALSDSQVVSVAGVGDTVVSYQVTDGALAATCQQVVSARDLLAPTATCEPDTTLALDGSCNATATFTATSADNCSGSEALPYTFAFFGPGSETHPFDFADASGNGASCSQTVTAQDVTAPVLSCPSDTVLPLDAACHAEASFEATGSDNCAGSLSDTEVVSVDGAGSTVVTYEVTDGAQAAQCTQVVSTQDVFAPEIACPADAVVALDAACRAAPSFTATASDNCAGASSETWTYGFGAAGSSTHTYAFADDSGNAASCAQTVTAEDLSAPTIACPADATLDLDASCHAAASFTAAGADNCASALSDTHDVDLDGIGQTTVTYQVSDGALTAECVQVVSAVDAYAPVADCPADAVVALDAVTCTADATFTATALDNCDGPSQEAHAFAFTGPGSQAWSYAFADASGNGASCTQTVTAEDSAAPVVTPSSAPVVLWPPNHKYERVTLADCGAAFDGCEGEVDLDGGAGSILLVTSDEPEDGKGNGDGSTRNDMVIVDGHTVDLRAEREGTGNGRVYTITYEVSDASGNTTTATCQVAVPHDQGKGSAAVADAPVYQVP